MNFFGLTRFHTTPPAPFRILDEMPRFKPPAVRLPKPPSVPGAASSFLWAFGLGLYIYLGGLSVALASPDVTLVVSVISGCVIYLFVRLYGEDDPNRP